MSGAGGLTPGKHARPERPIEADWLALRRPLDTAAREPARALIEQLGAWVVANRSPGVPVQVFDVGAGTGANQAYLAPRLPFPSQWTLLDHDPELLSHPGQGPGTRVVAGITDLAGLLDAPASGPAGAARAAGDPARVVTCSALLDLLTVAELDALADTLATRAVPALFALTVTSQVQWTPADPGDALACEAFTAHQERRGRPGPAAADYLRRACTERELEVHGVPTPWHIDTSDPVMVPFVLRWLDDYAAAAIEQQPDAAATITPWLQRRRRQVDQHDLRVAVGHEDLLILPAGRLR
ncbi:MAG: SAM-dependent methyltransferase [Austwickia sp.]|jgi:hypothetical protein|nr:SAM-dependent methyltransferase [Austwickia sp.]MBK8437245.1 SAM-dependent methyltransferase [Austwickia sp.]MBK9102478.1 SAM-dependent methyltransferase [Austwickia sp.]